MSVHSSPRHYSLINFVRPTCTKVECTFLSNKWMKKAARLTILLETDVDLCFN